MDAQLTVELHNLGWAAFWLIPGCAFFAILEVLFPGSR